ncbi:MAG: glycoside hydrolase family 3 C-terminal domain-containing protein [Oscillospiraceae bacterium]|nr:glycoside hydrolase family 3 C-terminal domain-containing protein [Oscillospiraceae bacterium]
MEKFRDPSCSAQERAEDLVDRLTVEEQAAQLIYDAPAIERLGIPAYNWWNEGLHGDARAGTATMFPQAIAMAAMFDADAVEKMGEIVSTEARAKFNGFSKHGDRDIYKGLSIWSPNINIFRDPRWGRGQETYGEDPYLTAELGKAFVRGLQGSGNTLRTAACAKHFAVHSGPESVRHGFDAVVDAYDLEDTYLPAFRALVQSGVEIVMGAYNRVNGECSCASDFLQKKLSEWNFNGHFVSDFGALNDIHENHKVTLNALETTALALKSGCDLNAGTTYENLMDALKAGMISEADIRKACVHVMRTRIRLGLLDESTEYDSLPYSVAACPAHKEKALEYARKSMVLLKNNGILPLEARKYSTIGVIGPVANNRQVLEGNYCGTPDRYITFLEGIQDAFGGRVLYAEGCHLYKDRVSGLARANDRLSEAEAVAEESDLIILCVGLTADIEGEEGDAGNEFASGDKIDLRLPAPQRLLAERIMNKGKPVIIITAAGSAINTECDADAILHCWYPGESGGKALAEILFGDISPSGKLPVTFYQDADLLPDFQDYSMKGRTYRYTRENILYPFGYGLTYSKTVCSDLRISGSSASVNITNTGDHTTDDVVQFYIQDDSSDACPYPKLCGFRRVSLEPGEQQTVSLEIPQSAFESVDSSGIRAVRGTRFTLYAGTSQPDTLSETLTGVSCVSASMKYQLK